MFLFRAFLVLIFNQFCVFPVGGNGGRLLQVNAYDYVAKYNEKLELGDCPIRELNYPNGTTSGITCPFKHTGDVHFIPLAQTEFEVKRVKKSEDANSIGGGGVGIGAGVLGLVSVKVKVKAKVDTQGSKKQLTLTNHYRMQRGVMTLRNAKPSGILPSDYPTQLYLSEIALGGEETLMVTMEFESEKKKTEVETTVTVKILWISISAKMRYISKNFRSAAAVKVTRLSTWRETKSETFVGFSSLELATKAVEKYEEDIESSPTELLKLPLDHKSLHAEYYFSLWGKPTAELQFNEALTNAQLEILNRQIEEIEVVLEKIDAYLSYANDGAMDSRTIVNLNKYKDEMELKLKELNAALSSYFLMSHEEREEVHLIYGSTNAPFYYTRKLNAIFTPGDDFTYLKEISY